MADLTLGTLIIAAIVASVTLSTSVVILPFLNWLCRSIRNYLFPKGALCKQLTRHEVIPSPWPLHNCQSSRGEGPPNYGHTRTPRPNSPACPFSLPSEFFSTNKTVTTALAKKPPELDYGTVYLKMDTWTLGAYLLHWQDKRLQPRVELKREGDILVCSVTADSQKQPLYYWPTICDLTRDDVDGILLGYPPFYRTRLLTIGGKVVRHPISDAGDILRGGWIAAIGLCQPVSIGKHRMKVPSLTAEERLEPLQYVIPSFKRIFEVLDNLQKAFPDEGLGRFCEVARAIRTRERSTTSRSERWFYRSTILAPFGGSRIKSQEYLKDISAEQCQTALYAFNNFNEPSDQEIRILRPVLQKVIVAVLHGMHKAAEWDERLSKEGYLDMSELEQSTTPVYVKEMYVE